MESNFGKRGTLLSFLKEGMREGEERSGGIKL
jgi:hypothetical protein